MTATDTKENASNTNSNANGSQVGEEGELSENPPRTPTPTDINIALRCVMRNDVERLVKCFEDEEDQFKETVAELINERDDSGKSPLDMASILGREDVLKELLARGADIALTTQKGYSSLHYAAAWGRISCLQMLVEGGGDIQLRTAQGERPREVAVRYHQTECVDFLDWAEAKQQLIQTVTGLQETMADPEKIQGKLDRSEKTSTLALIKEKMEWVENTSDATTQDFLTQRTQFEETVTPIIQKINEPAPEKPEKK